MGEMFRVFNIILGLLYMIFYWGALENYYASFLLHLNGVEQDA